MEIVQSERVIAFFLIKSHQLEKERSFSFNRVIGSTENLESRVRQSRKTQYSEFVGHDLIS